MILHFFRGTNFGDLLNPWLWPRYLGNLDAIRTDYIFCGIGTLLNDSLPPGPKVVFGSGVGYGKGPAALHEAEVFFVRGPRSAEALGLKPELALCDPAILISDHYRCPRQKKRDLGYMPHHEVADDAYLRAVCQDAGIHFIDPRNQVDAVLEEMGSCERMVTEAMHGAIVADALRIPWMPVSFHHGINRFKWEDYCTSLGLQHRPFYYSRTMGYCCKTYENGILRGASAAVAAKAFTKAIRGYEFNLSPASTLDAAHRRIEQKIEDLKQFLGA